MVVVCFLTARVSTLCSDRHIRACIVDFPRDQHLSISVTPTRDEVISMRGKLVSQPSPSMPVANPAKWLALLSLSLSLCLLSCFPF